MAWKYDPNDPPLRRINWLVVNRYEMDGGEELLEALLSEHRADLVGLWQDVDPVGPPDKQRWPHRRSEIREGAWKRWLGEIDDALVWGNEGLEGAGLTVQLTLSPRLGPAFELVSVEREPLYGEAARTLANAILDHLEIPFDALDLVARIFATRLDQVCSRLSYVRPEGRDGTNPIAENRNEILEGLKTIDAASPPDSEHWPHQPAAIDAEAWEDWLSNVNDALDECNGVLDRYELVLLVRLSRRTGPIIALYSVDDEDRPLRGKDAEALISAVLGLLEIQAPTLSLAISKLGDDLERACRRLDCVLCDD